MKTRSRWYYILRVLVGIAVIVAVWAVATQTNAALFSADKGGPAVASKGTPSIEISTPVKSDLSKPLREIAVIPPSKVTEQEVENYILPGRDKVKSVAGAFTDPALQKSSGSPNIPAPLQSFDGISNLFGGWPPDTEGDVGPNNFVQWINLDFQIWDKNGTSLYGPAAGNTLWSGFGGICQTNNDGDPVVIYDQLANRWFMSQFALAFPNNFHQCIAVSQTSDPLGAWYRYDFLWSTSKLNDYPKFGVWPDAYYMTANQFDGSTFAWAGQGVAAFERSKMLVGDPTARMVKFDLFGTDPNLGGMLPSDWNGQTQPPAGAPNPYMEVDDDAWGYSPDQVQIWNFHVDWTNTANSTFTFNVALPTAAFDSNMCNYARNCIPQPGTSAKVDAISDRLMYRLQYRNFGDHQTLVVNHTVDVDNTDHAGIRWYEIRNTGSGWSIYQQGTYSPDASHRWMGSIAMNGQGDIALGFSNSSTSIFPSVKYTGRVPGDPLGTLPQGEGTIVNGSGSQTDRTYSRWGDYSTMSVDPVDDCTFWYTQEWVQTTGSNTWKTRIGSFQVANCGAVQTGTLQGTVTDANTTAPIAGALVDAGGGLAGTTDANGNYQIPNMPAGTYNVTASATGYNSSVASGVVINAGQTTTQDFALTPAAGCTTNCLRVTAIQLQAGPSSTNARITVKDENGLAVSRAMVFVHWDYPGGTADQSKRTNTSGLASFRLSVASPGTYTITVTNITKTGYTFDAAGSTILTKSITR